MRGERDAVVESIAKPFEWKFTRADLHRILARLAAHVFRVALAGGDIRFYRLYDTGREQNLAPFRDRIEFLQEDMPAKHWPTSMK